ncbi:uncharacterized protein [Ptychodera flava]|uniref:uncharacterized protein isoform X2 n=1 Tax=Ptychodera flava TaxID=63121 RepID=UPI00396A7D8C
MCWKADRRVAWMSKRGHERARRDHRTLTKDGLVQVEKTFDLELLGSVISYATMSEFKSDCEQNVEVISIRQHKDDWNTQNNSSKLYTNYEFMVEFLRQGYNLTIPNLIESPLNLQDSLKRYSSPTSEKCLVLFNTNDFADMDLTRDFAKFDLSRDDDVMNTISKHLRRTKVIQEIGSLAEKYICDGKPYAALHWSKKLEDNCDDVRDTEYAAKSCRFRRELLLNNSALIAKVINDLMGLQGWDCLYFSSPLQSQNILVFMAAEIPKVYTVTEILIKYVPADMKEDDYFISLIEQEICSRAEIFITSSKSMWSDFVSEERRANLRASLMLHQLRGIPKDVASVL